MQPRTFRGNTRSVGPATAPNGQYRPKSPVSAAWVSDPQPYTPMAQSKWLLDNDAVTSKNHVEGVFYEGILNQVGDKFSGVNESPAITANGKYVAVSTERIDMF